MGETASSRPEQLGPLRIWDVERLRMFAAELPVRDVALAHLTELDRVVWYGHPEHVGRLTLIEFGLHMQGVWPADLSQPIVLSQDGYLLDGFHRLLKAHLLGCHTIRAVQFENDPTPDRILPPVEWPYASRPR